MANIRISNIDDACEVIGRLSRQGQYFTLIFALFYLYPVFTKFFLRKFNFNTNDVVAFFATSFLIVIALLVFSTLIKHLIIWCFSAVVVSLLFVSFVAYLIAYDS